MTPFTMLLWILLVGGLLLMFVGNFETLMKWNKSRDEGRKTVGRHRRKSGWKHKWADRKIRAMAHTNQIQ